MPVYGKVGEAGEYCMAPHLATEHGCIEMQTPPPSSDAIAQADGTWREADPAPTPLMKDLTMAQADLLCQATTPDELKVFLMEVFSDNSA